MNRSLFMLGMRHLVQGRTGVAALALCLVPAIAAVILFVRDALLLGDCPCTWDAGIGELVAGLVLGVTVPLTALLLAGGVVTDEVEDGTISYLLTRPLSRRRIYLMRVLPVLALGAVAGVLQVVVVAVGRLLAYMFLVPAEATVAWDGWSIATGMLAAILQMAVLVAVLSAINIFARRWRFTLGLAYLLAWELPAGLSGGAGLGFATAFHHARSIVDISAPQALTIVPSPLWLSVPWMVSWAMIWFWLANRTFGRRSIAVASGA